MQPFVQELIVRRYELGRNHRLRVQSLCNYMEEAAGGHAHALGVGIEHLKEQGLSWVLAKMRIVFGQMPEAGETVVVETWPVSAERLQFRRDFILSNRGEPFARAVTQWVVLNLASRRIERMPGTIVALTPEKPRLALQDADIRIPAVEDAENGPFFPVRLADIDQNGHVNNVRFTDFILEAADNFGPQGRRLAGLDIVFRAEALRGDVIAARTRRENSGACADLADVSAPCELAPVDILTHSLHRVDGNNELIRARTAWA